MPFYSGEHTGRWEQGCGRGVLTFSMDCRMSGYLHLTTKNRASDVSRQVSIDLCVQTRAGPEEPRLTWLGETGLELTVGYISIKRPGRGRPRGCHEQARPLSHLGLGVVFGECISWAGELDPLPRRIGFLRELLRGSFPP